MSATHVEILRSERDLLTAQIKKLTEERDALDRLLFKYEARKSPYTKDIEITKKNATKIYYWAIILKLLDQDNIRNGIPSREIYNKILELGEEIKYSTLRGYVFQLENAERIKKKVGTMRWILADDINFE